MSSSGFQFLDLPFEIQELILWKCLEGWKATVETHEKPERNKSTTRLWSSVVYDALMLSLTCKQFHKIVQDIQKDPRLFNGEIDMIEANAEMSYLAGIFTSNTNNYYIVERDSHPRPLYRTQVFIKASPYNRSDSDWRTARIKYHADVRDWLTQNVRSLGLWADEMTPLIPWQMFPSLENVTIYWPSTYLESEDLNLCLCAHSKEALVAMAKRPKNLMSAWGLHGVIKELEMAPDPRLSYTVKYEVPHVHTAEDFGLSDYNMGYEKLMSADFFNLECSFIVEKGIWTPTSIVCHEQSPMELDLEEVRNVLYFGSKTLICAERKVCGAICRSVSRETSWVIWLPRCSNFKLIEYNYLLTSIEFALPHPRFQHSYLPHPDSSSQPPVSPS